MRVFAPHCKQSSKVSACAILTFFRELATRLGLADLPVLPFTVRKNLRDFGARQMFLCAEISFVAPLMRHLTESMGFAAHPSQFLLYNSLAAAKGMSI